MNALYSEIASKVIRETDRAVEITRRLTDFSRPSNRQDAERVSVYEETKGVYALLRHELKVRDILFKNNLTTDLPNVLVNRRQLQEILFNILRNAAQASDKRPGVIEMTGGAEPGKVWITIRDNGMGIPGDKIKHIFSPFYTTKLPGKGTGLGLFIVKQVVERNGGTITVESREGEGTTFRVTFRAAEDAA